MRPLNINRLESNTQCLTNQKTQRISTNLERISDYSLFDDQISTLKLISSNRYVGEKEMFVCFVYILNIGSKRMV